MGSEFKRFAKLSLQDDLLAIRLYNSMFSIKKNLLTYLCHYLRAHGLIQLILKVIFPNIWTIVNGDGVGEISEDKCSCYRYKQDVAFPRCGGKENGCSIQNGGARQVY
jgi:hypothetical protein